MKKQQFLSLGILAGVLLFEAWPVGPSCFLVFIALVPLLILADKTTKRLSFFIFTFVGLLIFNAATTWWIWNSTDIGSVAAIVANSLLMCIPWWGFHLMLKKYGRNMGYVSLVCFLMLFEYIHLNWQLSWPWLTLGNVFAANPNWVQWYEYTGVAGGTLWVLLVNIFIKLALGSWVNLKRAIMPMAVILLLLVVAPLVTSYLILANKKNNTQPVAGNVLMVQPNINPYQKFEAGNAANEIQQMIALSESNIDSATKLILWPETALSVPSWQDKIDSNANYKPVFAFLQRHPNATLLSGIETFKNYGTDKATATARKADDGSYYDAFNSAIFKNTNQSFQLYNKSKLVPGVESMPTFLYFLAPVFEKFGGTTGGYGSSDSSKVFAVEGNPYHAAPVICYESIYGEYVGSYVKRGANLIAIITNDGWWGNTPGHKQHLQYARLRAIETRRWVARSANTGISAVIDDYGNIMATQPWNKVAVIKYFVPTTTVLTFYVQHGDWLYKIAGFIAALLIAWHGYVLVKGFIVSRKEKQI
ncbi:apolipoprotein N-acyltransferase [Parasediminibacterium sp. JCM 36343]|uniref:apolipoprotein N-acyltransferase n=1 Tax=Parasediminibacterium sp. JCM 36343 TaxID=3374279 RepID=UPI00397B08E7